MKVIRDIPPNYSEILKTFPKATIEKGILYTYGDTIYTYVEVTEDLFIHETVHYKQQSEIGIITWWSLYFSNTEFRLLQELEAYKEQYKYLKKNIKDRNKLDKRLRKIANDLSSNLYGNIITYSEALNRIKNGNS